MRAARRRSVFSRGKVGAPRNGSRPLPTIAGKIRCKHGCATHDYSWCDRKIYLCASTDTRIARTTPSARPSSSAKPSPEPSNGPNQSIIASLPTETSRAMWESKFSHSGCDAEPLNGRGQWQHTEDMWISQRLRALPVAGPVAGQSLSQSLALTRLPHRELCGG